MTTMESISHYLELWRLACPDIAEPTPRDAIRWCVYPLEAVEGAILQAARRFAKGRRKSTFVPQESYRFVTATARSLAERLTVPATSL